MSDDYPPFPAFTDPAFEALPDRAQALWLFLFNGLADAAGRFPSDPRSILAAWTTAMPHRPPTDVHIVEDLARLEQARFVTPAYRAQGSTYRVIVDHARYRAWCDRRPDRPGPRDA